jgi:hypothetical protein
VLHLEHSCVRCWILDTSKNNQKYLESFEMWCWRRTEKISWTDLWKKMKYYRVKEETNTLHTIKQRKANWLDHILHHNCFVLHLNEWKIEGTRRGRRRKWLLDDHKENRRYWNFKKEALDLTLWQTHFGRGNGPVARQDCIINE